MQCNWARTEKENERENPAALHSTVKVHAVRVSRIYCINQLSGIIPKTLPSAHKLRKAARMSVCSVLFVVLSNVLTNCFSRRGQSVVCLCFSENSFYLRSVQALAFLLWYFKYVKMHALKKN